MMAVGCIQAQTCHTNRCPVGVATQDKLRQRALDVGDKSERAFHFHQLTMETLSEVTAAAGLDHANQFRPWHVWLRINRTHALPYDEAFQFEKPGALLNGTAQHGQLQRFWELASADTFIPSNVKGAY
jgi:hypothetical protein